MLYRTRRRRFVPALLLTLLLICLAKFAFLDGPTSSHAAFDRDGRVLGGGLRQFLHHSSSSPHNNSAFNFSKVFGIEQDGIELSRHHHHQPRDRDINGTSHTKSLRDIVNVTELNMSATVNGKKYMLPLWQVRLKARENVSRTGDSTHRYFLTELLQVRIYEHDKAKWTLRELKQWMHYMFLAGVDHIYVCDHYEKKEEMILNSLKDYIDEGLVTYMEWGEVRHPLSAQHQCYQHIIDQHKYDSVWQIAIDMDEYPFCPQDTDQDFLVRLLKKQPKHISEISMQNFLMLGQGDRTRDMVIDRIDRITPKAANALVKPIYRPTMVRAKVHNNVLLGGKRIIAHRDELLMLHYWGARLQDWGPDTDHIRDITVPMTAMREAWTDRVRNSLFTFGETAAFSNSTGP